MWVRQRVCVWTEANHTQYLRRPAYNPKEPFLRNLHPLDGSLRQICDARRVVPLLALVIAHDKLDFVVLARGHVSIQDLRLVEEDLWICSRRDIGSLCKAARGCSQGPF